MAKLPKYGKKRIDYVSVSGKVLSATATVYSDVIAAMQESNGAWALIGLLSGKKICNLPSEEHCTQFILFASEEPKFDIKNPNVENTFAKAGGKDAFSQLVEKLTSKTKEKL